MEYITSWERNGRLEGKLEVAIELLTQHFGPLSDATTKRLRSLTLEHVEAWLLLLLDFKRQPAFNSKAELERWLRAHAPARRVANGQHQRGQQ